MAAAVNGGAHGHPVGAQSAEKTADIGLAEHVLLQGAGYWGIGMTESDRFPRL